VIRRLAVCAQKADTCCTIRLGGNKRHAVQVVLFHPIKQIYIQSKYCRTNRE